MEFKQLYYFVETCKRMNFAVTAEALYVTPQALSKSIKTLENNLGQKLFYLNKNALILTEFGEFFLPKAQNLLAEYYAMRNEVASLSKNYNGLIRVGIVPSAKKLITADFLQDFMEKYPDIRVYQSYDNPYWKISVGDFRTRESAQKLYHQLLVDYPKAFIIPQWINFPPLE